MVLSHSFSPGNLDVERWGKSLAMSGYMAQMHCGASSVVQDDDLADGVLKYLIVTCTCAGSKGIG